MKMCDSVIQFSALLSMPLGNRVTVTMYDNLAHAELFTFYAFWHLFKLYIMKGHSCQASYYFMFNTPGLNKRYH